MKQWERALRQILYSYFEEDQRFMSQRAISENCWVSIGTVNLLVKKLEQLGAIEIRPQGFRIIDLPRALLYWANTRSFHQDVVGRIPTSKPVEEIERHMPPGSAVTCFSAFRRRFGRVPQEYNQVHVYGNSEQIRKLFPGTGGELSEIVVLQPDRHLTRLSENGVVPFAQMYVDLWQTGQAGKPYIDELNASVRRVEVGALRGIIQRTRRIRTKEQTPPSEGTNR